MKLRIRGDSIRLRLTQSEVATLVDSGRIEESTAFGPSPLERFSYAIVLGGEVVAAKSTAKGIEIVLPAATGRAWASSASVGIEAEQPAGDGRTLRILVEKDFACLTQRPHEDDSDAFPNPNTSC
ncbi:MAG TPA: hypothetical protein VM580_13415 [Labilithrix sp.]|jgi:hypothetical protein|nr:hypothetical protein [Labilithrix sp.]